MVAIPVLLTGGTEVQTLSMVRVLRTAGYIVTVCCYYEFDQSMVVRFEEAGAEIVLFKLDRSGYKHFKIIELIRRLVAVIKELDPDIIHVQYVAPGLLPIIAARIARAPTVFSTVHIAGRTAYGWKAKILLRIAAALATSFFCVSKGVEDFWFGDSKVFHPGDACKGRKHFTIYNAVDVSAIEEAVDGMPHDKLRDSLGIEGRPVIGVVGRLAYQKGHAILLDAIAEMAGLVPGVLLLVIGDGPLRGELERRAKELDIGGHVRWLGTRGQEEVFKLYGAMDVLAMPSLYEGFGLTAAEAMAAGLPVVGTSVDGLSEVIEDDLTGYIVPAGDSRALSEALLGLLTNAGLRKEMGERGRLRVKKLFSMERLNQSLIAAYELLSGKS